MAVFQGVLAAARMEENGVAFELRPVILAGEHPSGGENQDVALRRFRAAALPCRKVNGRCANAQFRETAINSSRFAASNGERYVSRRMTPVRHLALARDFLCDHLAPFSDDARIPRSG
jgi:hypothetical protein